MKKMTACLATVFLLLFAAALAEDRIYLAIGDSITTGNGLPDKEQGFAPMLAEKLGLPLVNMAKDGNTAEDLLMLLEDEAFREVVSQARLITITCGGNDLMGLLYQQIGVLYNEAAPVPSMTIQPDQVVGIMANSSDIRRLSILAFCMEALMGNEEKGIPPFVESESTQAGLNQYAQSLHKVVTALHQMNPDALVVVATQYNPYRFFTGMYQVVNTGIEEGVLRLNQEIKETAQMTGYQVADVYTVFSKVPYSACNASMEPFEMDFHPNEEGHQLIAECMQQVIEQME